MSKSMGFACPKIGHAPMQGVPEEVVVLGGYPHVGRVCRRCRGVYYEQVGNRKMVKTGVLDVDGKEVIDMEVPN